MAEILEVEIVAKLDDIQKSLDKINKKAEGAGKKAGSSFGDAFVSVAQTVLATISFNAVLGGINSAVGAYRNLNTVQTSLATSIDGINKQTRANNDILTDSNSTLTQKAQALGINVEQYEKTAKASGGAGNASKAYKENLVDEERSLKSKSEANQKEIDKIKEVIETKKDSVESINKSIKALEDERDAKLDNANATDQQIKKEDERIRKQEAQLNKQLKAITTSYQEQFGAREIGIKQEVFDQQKILNGYKTQERALNDNKVANASQLVILANQREQVQNKIDALRQEQEQINLNRDSDIARLELQQFGTKRAIEADKERLASTKETNSSIKDDYSSQIDLQKKGIDTIKNSITDLQKTVEDKQSKFDINTEPAKKKIEELKQKIQDISLTSSGGGGGKVLDTKALSGAVNAAQIKKGNEKEISGKDVGQKVDAAYEKLGGTVSKATLAQGFTNIFQGGIKDADQANTLLMQYVDSAANGKSSTISLNQAVNNLSETFKTGSSSLGNLSGITQNYDKIDAAGLEIMKQKGETQAKNVDGLSQEERARARMLGTLKTEAIANGTFNKLMEQGVFEQDKMNAKTLELQQNIGQALTPAFNQALQAITPVIEGFSRFVSENPQVVTGIAGVALALTGLLTVASGAGTIATLFGTGGVLAGATPILAGFGAGLAGLALPVAAIGLAFVGLKLAYDNNFGGIQDKFNAFVADWQKGWDTNVKPVLDQMNTKFDEAGKVIGGVFKEIGDVFAKYFEPIFDKLGKLWDKIFEKLILPTIPFIQEQLGGMFKFLGEGAETSANTFKIAWEAIKPFIEGVLSRVSEFFTGFIDGIVGLLDGDGGAKMSEAWTRVFNGFKDIAAGILNSIVTGIVNALNSAIQKIRDFLSSLPDTLGEGAFLIRIPKPNINNITAPPPIKFASGGIVGGNSNYGDRIPAYVNSGEMILNRMQQAQLFAMANGNQNNSKNVTINQNNNLQGNQIIDLANKQLAFLLQNNIS